MKQRNPKTKTLLQYSKTEVKLRLLPSDRAFLRDLARLQILSEGLAKVHHYSHLKGGAARSLGRLEKAGFVHKQKIFIPGRGVEALYQFSNKKIARAWGGKLPEIGAKRNEFHELITSELYYKVGQPEDFHLANLMTEKEIAAFNGHKPDAVFTDETTGQPVAVEADSGHYKNKQIRLKLLKWQGHRQVWGQPRYVAAHVPPQPGITVHRIL